jgi:hypothetical protein
VEAFKSSLLALFFHGKIRVLFKERFNLPKTFKGTDICAKQVS